MERAEPLICRAICRWRIYLPLSMIMLLWSLNQTAYAVVLRAGKEQRFTTIRQALAAASAGDTILVQPGLYREGNIIIDKRLTLLGLGYPVLDGERKWEVLSVKAGGVVVDGFQLAHGGRSSTEDLAGIKVYNVSNVTIRNNILDDNIFAIYLQYCTGSLVQNNRIKAYGSSEQLSGNGIHCWKSDSVRIIGNEISGHRDGIYLEFVTGSIIWRNHSRDNIRYGLHFMFSHNDAYISNVFSNNGAGVAVMYTHGIRMFNNYFEKSWGESAYGLLLKEISNSYIEGNHFSHNTIGIHMEGSSRIVIARNLFEDNGYAMRIQGSCEDDELVRNDFSGNTFDISTNSSMSLNFFEGNYWDKYEGYDLGRDGVGDVPYHPVSLFSTIVESYPAAMMLFRSFMVTLLDKSEKVLPSITPQGLLDTHPVMKPNLHPRNRGSVINQKFIKGND